MITQIQRVSDLQLLLTALSDAKLIVANKEQKTNYAIKVPQVQGDKIININEIEASGESITNVIDVSFNTLGSKYFIVYNGHQGEQGQQGNKGEDGDKGDSPYQDLQTNKKVLVIANDDVTDNNEYAVWSGYRGKVYYDFLNSLSEIILNADTYDLLFRDEVFLQLEFNTKADNQDITIVNYDTSNHKKYVKYWTYEDDGLDVEYFIKNGDEYIKLENFDVWKDFYLSDELSECYTRTLESEIINTDTGETNSWYEYHPVNKPTWMYLEFETISEDTTSNIIYSTTNLPDDEEQYIIPDTSEEEVIVSHIRISSIKIDDSTSITIKSDINNIITKAVTILPTNYINSPIGIEYDENMVKVFEDGRIMALDTPGETTVRIYSIENPNIYAEIHLNIVILVNSLMFESTNIKGYVGDTIQLNPIITPSNATNKELKYTIIDDDYKVISFEDAFIIDEETNNISLKDENVDIFIKEQDAYIKLVINNLTDDYQLLANDFVIYSKDDDEIPTLYKENLDVIGTVDQTGLVTFIKEGEVSIKAETTDNTGLSAMITLNVLTKAQDIVIDRLYRKEIESEDEEEEMIVLDNCYDILIDTEGKNRFMNTIEAQLLPSDTSVKELSWELESLNPNVYLSVSDDTLSCQIKVTRYTDPIKLIVSTIDGGARKEIYLIGKTPISNIYLNSDLITLDLGDTYNLTATIFPNSSNNKNLEWSISNSFIADLQVSEDTHSCKVITKNGGDAIITVRATDGSNTYATCRLESVILITGIELNNNAKMVVYGNGNTYEIPYIITPAEAYNKTLKWYSTNDNIAHIDGQGRFIAGTPGNAKIYAVAQDNSGVVSSIDIEVLIASEEIILSESSEEYIILSSYNLDLNVNDNYTLITAVYPDNASLQVLNYISEDPTIAEVDNNGNITALKPGTTKIIITTNDKDGKELHAECVVNIN